MPTQTGKARMAVIFMSSPPRASFANTSAAPQRGHSRAERSEDPTTQLLCPLGRRVSLREPEDDNLPCRLQMIGPEYLATEVLTD